MASSSSSSSSLSSLTRQKPLPRPVRVYGLSSDNLKSIWQYCRHPSRPSFDLVQREFLPSGNSYYRRVAVRITQEIETKGIETEKTHWLLMSHEQLKILQSSRCEFDWLDFEEGDDDGGGENEKLDWSQLCVQVIHDPKLIAAVSHGTSTHEGEELIDVMKIPCFATYLTEQKRKQQQQHENDKDKENKRGSKRKRPSDDEENSGSDDDDDKEVGDYDDDDDDDEDDDDGGGGGGGANENGSEVAGTRGDEDDDEEEEVVVNRDDQPEDGDGEEEDDVAVDDDAPSE